MKFHRPLSGYLDSNQGPPAPKAGTLANCATPRTYFHLKNSIYLKY